MDIQIYIPDVRGGSNLTKIQCQGCNESCFLTISGIFCKGKFTPAKRGWLRRLFNREQERIDLCPAFIHWHIDCPTCRNTFIVATAENLSGTSVSLETLEALWK